MGTQPLFHFPGANLSLFEAFLNHHFEPVDSFTYIYSKEADISSSFQEKIEMLDPHLVHSCHFLLFCGSGFNGNNSR